jgi:hypothetical protein
MLPRAGAGGRTSAGGKSGGLGGTDSSGAAGSVSGGAGADESAGAGGSSGRDGALLFSEYVEGSASFKALEIHALRTTTLDGCRVATFSNGSIRGSGPALAGELSSGKILVLCSSELAERGVACKVVEGLRHNGNDAIALECDGIVIDSIGQIGVDPGTAWESEGVSTANRTLRRRCDVLTGDSDPSDEFNPSLEWQSFPEDTFEGLGRSDCP